jgi:hypothetical protein
VSFTRPVPAGSAIASKRQLLIETTPGKTMLFLGFIVLLLIIGKIHADNERAEQERQEQREYTTRKWQQAADEDELFRLEMGAKGCAWQRVSDPEWLSGLLPSDVRRLEFLRSKLNKRWVSSLGWQSLDT